MTHPTSHLSPEQLAAVAALWSRSGRELVVRFTGSSMGAALPSGCEVRLRCGEGGAVGDVVAFRRGDGVIVHRVVARARDGRWILTRGDARVLPDAPFAADAILGRVEAVRVGDVFVDPPAAPDSALQSVVLWPLVLALRGSAPAGAALIGGLAGTRRTLLRAAAALRSRLSAPPRR